MFYVKMWITLGTMGIKDSILWLFCLIFLSVNLPMCGLKYRVLDKVVENMKFVGKKCLKRYL